MTDSLPLMTWFLSGRQGVVTRFDGYLARIADGLATRSTLLVFTGSGRLLAGFLKRCHIFSFGF